MIQKSYEVVFKKSAVKELRDLPVRVRGKVMDAIQLLSINPFTEILQIKKLKGAEHLYRVRIQDYRVIYLVENQVIKITIIKIAHRREAYE